MLSSEDFFLNVINSGEVQRFDADEPGVTHLKVDTENEAQEFVYLRKGEDFGGFITQLIHAASFGIDQLTILIKAYAPLNPEIMKIHIKEPLEHIDDLLEIYLIITGIKNKWQELSKDHFRYFSKFPLFKRPFPMPEVKILCNPDERNEGARRGWEALGHEVRHYSDPKQSGSHRLYLTEKRYVLFYRSPNSKFFGLLGRDKDTICHLKELFIEEWENAIIPKPIRE